MDKEFWAATEYFFYRTHKFRSQKQLAITAGVSQSVVSEVLQKNRGFHENTKSKIAKAFGFKLFDFLAIGRRLLEGQTPEENPIEPTPSSKKEIELSFQPETEEPEEDFNLSEALSMTETVLKSGTSYATALYLNIQHFERAVRAEAKIAQVEHSQKSFVAQLEEIRQQIADLKLENEELRHNQKHDRRARDNPDMIPGDSDRRSGKDRRKVVGEE